MPRPKKTARKESAEPALESVVIVPPTMHRIFDTVELVDQISSHLEKAELLALTTTSRHFVSSALEHLYRDLEASELQRLLSNVASSSVTPSAMGVERFVSHAKLVRNLQLRVSRYGGVDGDTLARKLSVVIARSISLPIFPSLRSISTAVSSPSHLVIMLSILNGDIPFLHTLTIQCGLGSEEPEELSVLLEILPVRCPHLRNLDISIHGYGAKPDMSSVLSVAVGKLRHLVHVSLGNVNMTVEMLQSLSRHPTLDSLVLRNAKGQASGSISSGDPPISGHPRLRQLDLAVQVADAALILQAFPDTLEELKIDTSIDSGKGSDIRDLAQAIARFPRLIQLDVDLSSTERGSRRVSSGGSIPMTSILTPIFSCHKLRVLRFYGDYEVEPPEDEDFKRAAASCQDLRSLKLRWREKALGPSLQSLLALSHGCPDLSIVELSSLCVKDKGFLLPAGVTHPLCLSLAIGHLSVDRLDALAVMLAGRWSSVKIRAGSQTDALLDCIRTVRRYQAGQSPEVTVYDPDIDSALRQGSF